jgi:site-specific DNA-methyltransferase (adenine-specific)
VLDCFGGSGSTAIGALSLNRRTVAMEIEPKWARRIAARVRAWLKTEDLQLPDEPSDVRETKKERCALQMALFHVGK